MNKKIDFIPAVGIIILCSLLVGTVVVLISLQIKESIKISSFEEEEKESQEQSKQIDGSGENKTIKETEKIVLKESLVEDNEREMAFLYNGDIWVINKNLDKKYKLIDTEKDIVYFDISPDDKEFYWHNGKEIWKRDSNGSDHLLIKADEISESEKEIIRKDFENYKKSTESFDVEEELKKISGGIMNFYLSPDGKYIVFEQVEGFGGCCGGPPNKSIGGIFIVKNDGTGKIKIEKPPQAIEWRNMMNFWLWSSKDKIIVSLRAMDESFGSFYEVSVIGEFTDRIPKEEFYSPDRSKSVYLEGNKIILKDIKTGETKTILESESLPFPHAWLGLISRIVDWSKDSNLLLVRESNKICVFTKDGNKVDELNLSPSHIGEVVLSPDSKYVAGDYMKDKYKTSVIFFKNLLNQEVREVELPGIQTDSMFFSDDNRFYYLAEIEESKYELWTINTDTWNRSKLLENTSNIVKAF